MNGMMQLTQLAIQQPNHIALQDNRQTLSYRELLHAVSNSAQWLRDHNIHRLALALDNSIAFVVWDLAAQWAGCVCIPLPLFFSASQQQHVLEAASVDLVLAPTQLAQSSHAADFKPVTLPNDQQWNGNISGWLRAAENPTPIPKGTSKITFTSGTTGAPKGVCLSAENQWRVADSLQTIAQALEIHSHLCVLPLAVLLENVAGVYTALLAGARVLLLPLAEVGLRGSSQFAPQQLLKQLQHHHSHSMILLPQMLQALVSEIERSPPLKPESLRFIAVGGARVAPELIERANVCRLPVYEGYGLSECASVVAVNRPGTLCVGTVGKPLTHVHIEQREDGELRIHGNAFLGYLNNHNATEAIEATPQYVDTGDLGRLDIDGYLHIDGRKKHLLITSFGRNISPEWPESELLAEPQILQAVVFGEAQARLSAIVVGTPDATAEQLQAAIRRVNTRLPDYAALHHVVFADEPFSSRNGLLTSNGRPKREAVWQYYESALRTEAESSSAATRQAEIIPN
jgi:long-chain acyl-CoA synthetase